MSVTTTAHLNFRGDARDALAFWYDLFPLPDGAVGLALGDVMATAWQRRP